MLSQFQPAIKNAFSMFNMAVVVLVSFCLGLVSCQKEFTIEGGIDPNSGTQSGTAVFSPAGSPDACTIAILHGQFIAGKPVGDTCTVTVSVNVTDTGTYAIATRAVNGVTFSASGTFTTTGNQNIVLKASGTPLAAGTFKLIAGASGCSFSVTVINAPVILAEYSFDGAPNACATDSVAGTYLTGVPLDTSNKVFITAHVTKAGAFNISTGATNGITFSASGDLDTGTQVIVLQGSGTPAAVGTNSFTAGANGCSFPVTVTTPVPAVFTLSGGPGACSVPVVNGVYQAKVPMSTANTVTINVDVTTPGVFTIISNTANGLTFSSTGKFPAIGTNVPVTLYASGTPEGPGATTFTPLAAAPTCTFDITVTAAPTGTLKCKVDGVLFDFINDAHADLDNPFVLTGGVGLQLYGIGAATTGDVGPKLQVSIANQDNSTVNPGTYNVDNFLKYIIAINLDYINNDNSTTIFATSSSILTPSPPFTMIVTEKTATRVKGTFSGKLTNIFEGSNKTKTVTEGTFDLPIF